MYHSHRTTGKMREGKKYGIVSDTNDVAGQPSTARPLIKNPPATPSTSLIATANQPGSSKVLSAKGIRLALSKDSLSEGVSLGRGRHRLSVSTAGLQQGLFCKVHIGSMGSASLSDDIHLPQAAFRTRVLTYTAGLPLIAARYHSDKTFALT